MPGGASCSLAARRAPRWRRCRCRYCWSIEGKANASMALEIERRFLVRDPQAVFTAPGATRSQHTIQGYFGRVEGLRIRVRILTEPDGAHFALLTFKGARRGLCRVEYEYP